MARGYTGKVLWVDLTHQEIKEDSFDEQLCKDYIGGYGIGAKVLFDKMPAGVDPLGPENILGVVTGPMTGTGLGGARYVVVGKSPLTGGWGDANSGGDFGPKLKMAGIDAVFFTGISEKPVYLYIEDSKAELRDAADLWGKDTNVTEDMLVDTHGKKTGTMSIGPAGEKLSLIAAIINDKGRAAGRSGMGAVMGSKRLKAIAVNGTIPIPVFDDEKVKAAQKQALKGLGGHVEGLKAQGTAGMFGVMCMFGDAPTKNWEGTAVIDFPQYETIGAKVVEEHEEKKYGCYKCPVRCGGHMKSNKGKFAYEGAHKPEYETLGMYGSSVLNDDFHSVVKCHDLSNRLGLDVISAGGVIAFVTECYEKGILTKEDTDGIEMTWGNGEAFVKMTEKLGMRDGFGDLIADGVKIAAEKIGKGSEEYAIHILGQEVPAHSPNFGLQWAVAYQYDATPARHTQGGGPFPPGVHEVELPNPRAVEGRGAYHKRGSSVAHAIQSMGNCTFIIGGYAHINHLLDLINAITGFDYTLDDIIDAGERITQIRHVFGWREGVNCANIKMSGRLTGHPPATDEKHPLKGASLDLEGLKKEYLTAMGWDMDTAKPSVEALERLGMGDVAAALK